MPFGTIRYSAVQYINIYCDAVRHITIRYGTVQYGVVQFGKVQLATKLFSTVWYSCDTAGTDGISTARRALAERQSVMPTVYQSTSSTGYIISKLAAVSVAVVAAAPAVAAAAATVEHQHQQQV